MNSNEPSLLNVNDPELLAQFVEQWLAPLVEYDAEHNTELLHTLNAYFTNNGNMARTAHELNIHRNTLVYRLGREMFDPATGAVAALLTATSPAALLLNGTLMGHTAALFATTLLMFAFWRMERAQDRERTPRCVLDTYRPQRHKFKA